MADYISREAAISEIMSEPTDAHYPSWYAEKLKQIPAADVRPVVRGKWEVGGMFDDIGRCSCCHYMFPSDTAMTEFRFCPNCGAEMEPNLDATKGDSHD